MKIVLIEPKSTHIHVYSKVPIPRIGSVLLATILTQKGHEVDVYIEELGPIDFAKTLEADVVGISVLTSTANRSYHIADIVRAAGIPVILGGTHPTFETDEALDHSDFVIRGEGEESILELLEAMRTGGGYEDILGLSWWRGEEKVHNEKRPLLQDLDVNPIPDYSLVHNSNKSIVISMMTGRGCPFECSFCTVPVFNGRGFRMHSVERVLEEVRFQTSQRKVHYLFFGDDIFNLKKKRMAEILEGMIRQGTTPRWGAQVRHELSRDREMLDLMKRAGCDRVYVGFESINPATLELFKKHETREDVVSAVQNFHKAGLSIHGMFVLGSDEDTPSTLVETRKFAREYDIDTVQFMILTPMPGTKDLAAYEEGGRKILHRNWANYDGHHVVHEPKRMTAYDLQVGAVTAMRDFYSLGAVASKAMKGDWFNVLLRFAGYRLTRKWFKVKENQDYMKNLKKEFYEKLGELGVEKPAKPKRSVVLSDMEGLENARVCMETFFRELGVQVIHSKNSLVTAMGDGGAKLAEGSRNLSKRFLEYLESFRGKTDYIVLSTSETMQGAAENLRNLSRTVYQTSTQLPQLINLPSDRNIHVPAMLVSLGLLYTDDLERIQRAMGKAMAAR